MRVVVFTIVTIGETWDSLEGTTQQELTRRLRVHDPDSLQYQNAVRSIQAGTALSPATGHVVAVGVHDVEGDLGVIHTTLENEGNIELPSGWRVQSGIEGELLSWFWGGVHRYEAVVSFAGRSFGLPFLAHRAVRYDITPWRPLFGARRLAKQQSPYHIDLQDELSYYGAMRKRLSLPMWCRTYDIPFDSARAEPDHIQEWWTNGDAAALTQHVVSKLQATTALYHRWCAHLAPIGWSGQPSGRR